MDKLRDFQMERILIRLEGPIIQLVRLEGDDKTARLVEELHEMKKKMGDMKNILKAKAAAI